jgi:hypothetical protein
VASRSGTASAQRCASRGTGRNGPATGVTVTSSVSAPRVSVTRAIVSRRGAIGPVAIPSVSASRVATAAPSSAVMRSSARRSTSAAGEPGATVRIRTPPASSSSTTTPIRGRGPTAGAASPVGPIGPPSSAPEPSCAAVITMATESATNTPTSSAPSARRRLAHRRSVRSRRIQPMPARSSETPGMRPKASAAWKSCEPSRAACRGSSLSGTGSDTLSGRAGSGTGSGSSERTWGTWGSGGGSGAITARTLCARGGRRTRAPARRCRPASRGDPMPRRRCARAAGRRCRTACGSRDRRPG